MRLRLGSPRPALALQMRAEPRQRVGPRQLGGGLVVTPLVSVVVKRVGRAFVDAVVVGGPGRLERGHHVVDAGVDLPVLADQLGRWLGRSISSWVDVDLAVPISIPMVRRVVRGFDQGHRIGLGVAAETGIACSNHLKRRPGPRQVGKSGTERRKLPISTFSTRGTLNGERILLVDDVVTTGATIHAAARVLKRCGASHIWVATVAHQGP